MPRANESSNEVLMVRPRKLRHIAVKVAWIGLCCGLAADGRAAGGSQSNPAPPQKLDVVEVVGCLTSGANGSWLVTGATDPAVSKEPYTNQAELKAASEKPLGTKQYALLAVKMFNPDAHKGHKVSVKGLLIADAKGDRLNVTSLQMVADTCK